MENSNDIIKFYGLEGNAIFSKGKRGVFLKKKVMKTQKNILSFVRVFQPVCNNYWYNNCPKQREPAIGQTYAFIYIRTLLCFL